MTGRDAGAAGDAVTGGDVGTGGRERGGERPPLEVKICGITRREDAEAAAAAGADYLGLILAPGSPRSVDPRRAGRLVDGLSPVPVAVLVDPTVDEAVAAAGEVGAGVVQLHGEEDPETVERIRAAGAWEVWKAVPVRDERDVRSALERYGGGVDGLLFDGWHPDRRGGSGTRFPPEAVGRLQSAIPVGIRMVAAGGLHPQNIRDLVRELRPHVVDVSSGVEARPGVKDADRIRDFIENARPAASDRPR